MKKFPFYQQMDAMDCGATCLRMIAKHHGRIYSQKYLREISHVDREGVSLMGISDAAEHIGMHTLGVKVTYDRILQDLPVPFIAHWRQNHFIVVRKATDTHVWIADPAAGLFKITKEEFLDGWASDQVNGELMGILLLIEPTPDFYERDDEKIDKGNFGYLWAIVSKYGGLVGQVILGLVVGSLLQLAFPFLVQMIVDKGIIIKDVSFIKMILIAQFALFTTRIGVEFLRSWILLHVGVRVNITLISDFLAKLMKLPVRYFDTKLTGDLLQRIYDNKRIENFLTSASLITLFSLFNFVVFGFVLAYYSKTILFVFVVATILYVLWVLIFLKKRREYDYRRFDQMATNQSSLIELIDGIEDIKLHNAEREKRWEWERIQSKLFTISIKVLQLDQWQRFGTSFINESKNILITFIAAKLVIEGKMTLGMMLAIQYIIGQLNGPIEQLIQFILSGQDAHISLQRMNEVHLEKNEEDVENKINILPENQDLSFENVYFQYGGSSSPVILKNINVNFPKGKTTAIVGSSGSGKTTMLKLLLNFYQATEGQVKLGELDLKNIQNRLWRSKCGAVLQDSYIFSDTIAKNIALGEDYIDQSRLLKAVKVANIQMDIESMPLSYNTKIGSNGVGLSQGQKQRLMIARAIYKNPEFMFFDEATNALDAYNEMIIMDNLEEFFKGKTVVVVAHRLSTVKNADNIIVLEKGEVIEQGTHEELTKTRGSYYHLVKNQLELGN
ncbi:MAG: peptidase domain-containing ABC transporter [Saprospiraceae bacterium]